MQKSNPDKFQVLHNEKNLRLAASLNRCIEYTRGEYIARMDDDDVSLPERFAKEVAYLDAHPDVSFVSANIKLFDEDGIWGIRKCTVDLNARNIYRLSSYRSSNSNDSQEGSCRGGWIYCFTINKSYRGL